MKLDSASEDRIYRACITWDMPALRDAGREDVDLFRSVVQLSPTAFNSHSLETPKRMTPIRRSAEGLRAELSGEREVARNHYAVVARRQSLPGLLGALLLAWMSDATEEDFDRVERKLATLSGPGTRDIVARSHCKLATWALDHGWVDRAGRHYDAARRSAGKDLRMAIDGVGHSFRRQQVLYFKPLTGEMIAFPWIADRVDGAARAFVEKQLRESVKSPWTRTWTFGEPSVEGIEIQSASMQASWAGAIWMVAPIHRQHAALILAKSDDADDVARAIALWAKGSGKDVSRLVSSKEASLTAGTVDELLTRQLQSGRSVPNPEVWLDICHALWAELPERLVDDIVAGYGGPPREARPYAGNDAKELGLFAKLVVRTPRAVEQIQSFDDWEAGLLARSSHPELLAELPPEVLVRLLQAGVSDVVLQNHDWASEGWAALLTCWALLAENTREEYREALLRALPNDAVSAAVSIAPGLVPENRMRAVLKTGVALLEQELRDSRNGTWTGWGLHPAVEVARLALASGRISEDAVRRLVAIAVAPTTSSQQRRTCLEALVSLAKAGLVDGTQVERAFAPVAVRPLMTDDVQLDQRLEDILRLILELQVGGDHADAEGRLLAASRDADAQIRLLAVGAVCQLTIQGQTSASFDATLLGALYDPHPRVQAQAVPALWRGRFESDELLEVARSRLADAFPSAHRELRVTIASEIARVDGDDQLVSRIREMAGRDRSWVVRRAVVRGED